MYNYLILIGVISIVCVARYWEYRREKRNWNNGKCWICGKSWEKTNNTRMKNVNFYSCGCNYIHITFKRITK